MVTEMRDVFVLLRRTAPIGDHQFRRNGPIKALGKSRSAITSSAGTALSKPWASQDR